MRSNGCVDHSWMKKTHHVPLPRCSVQVAVTGSMWPCQLTQSDHRAQIQVNGSQQQVSVAKYNTGGVPNYG